MTGPLAGIRVLDFCHFLAGPYATMILADLGAEVIKVEDPDRPDEARSLGPHFVDGQSLYFASLNWGKRSVGARLSRPEGRALVLDLVGRADVIVDNFRPGVMAKIGLGEENLRAANPRIVTCSLSGFGETGPYSSRAGYDYTIQALAGVMSLTGEPDGPPGKAGISYVDHSGGMAAALAVCAALVERDRTGTGRHVDLGLFDVQASMLTYLAAWQLNVGAEPQRTANAAHPSLVPAQTFATRDGHLSIFVGNDPMWARLVAALGDERLADPAYSTTGGRHENRTTLIALLEEILRTDGCDHWAETLHQHGVPCAPVNTIGHALSEPQVAARDLVCTASHPSYGDYQHMRGPLPAMGGQAATRGAPLLGENTQELLEELGWDTARIENVVSAGIAVVP